MSIARETLKHATIYSAASLLGKSVGFVMLPFYAHGLGAEGYGVIGMVDASIALLTSLLGYGCQTAITRMYHEQPDGRKALAVSTGFWLVSGITAVMVAIAMAASGPISHVLFGDTGLSSLLCLAMLSFLLDMSGHTAGVILLIERRSFTYSVISLLRLVSGLTLNIALIVVLDMGVLGYFLSATVTSLLSYVVLQHICFRDCGLGYNPQIGREIVRYQMPLIPSALVSFAARQSERIVLRFVESIERVGLLEMGYKFPGMLQLLIHGPLMQSWNTERIRIAQRGHDQAPREIGDMFTVSLFLLTFGGLLIALCIEDLLVLLMPQEFWGAKRIAQIECLTVIISSVTYHSNFGFTYRKDTAAWARLSIGVGGVKIVLSLLFISWLGILGAAYSALCAASVLFTLAFLGGQRRYAIKYRRGANLLICGCAAAIFILTEIHSERLMQTAQAASSWLHQRLDLPGIVSTNGVTALKLQYAIDAAIRLTIGCGFIALLPLARGSTKLRMGRRRDRLLSAAGEI